jgi:hypothetical protein
LNDSSGRQVPVIPRRDRPKPDFQPYELAAQRRTLDLGCAGKRSCPRTRGLGIECLVSGAKPAMTVNQNWASLEFEPILGHEVLVIS